MPRWGITAATAIAVSVSASSLASGLGAAGIALSPSQLQEVDGVLIGTDTAARIVAEFGATEAAKIHTVVADSFVSGLHMGLWLCAAVTLIGVVAALFLPGPDETTDA